ncbi:MAG: type II toxin-antitoxin system Phd/YefM family antitoxin [Candidatus Promineofilum sp.]|nr:type II toxin-antitoxin system Phd/YefM family antitoxin [Promineifilum sp.]
MQFNIHEAKTNLSKLIRLAEAGEEVIIARDDVPIVRLMPVVEVQPRRRAGGAVDFILYMADDFDAPLDDFEEYMS